jgi:hypothetical protein
MLLQVLRAQIKELKEHLHDKNSKFGIDLLLPQVSEGLAWIYLCD